MYKMKAQYDYVRNDETRRSHFTRTIQKGINVGKITGCKYGASEDKGNSPLYGIDFRVSLPEIWYYLLKVKPLPCPRTSWIWAASPASRANEGPSMNLQLLRGAVLKFDLPEETQRGC